MKVTTHSLKKLEQHWLIKIVGNKQIEKAIKLTNRLDYTFSQADYKLLNKVYMAYEVAAVEGLDDLLYPTSDNRELRRQCVSGAYRAFEISRLFKLPDTDGQKIFHILHISSLAYCGGRWADLRRWYNENNNASQTPSVVNVPWDSRLLFRLFECWVRLFRKKSWDDLDLIREIIAGLREDQKQYEKEVLNDSSNAKNRVMALRLIALYHWARATEVLVKYIQGEPARITSLLNKHFESAIAAAKACSDIELINLLPWLHVVSRQMAIEWL